jgi:SAM-dependent methyltransferase
MLLAPRSCPVCGSTDAEVFSEANLDDAKLDGFAFASRKTPELMHHRLLHCRGCDLLYASPAPKPGGLAQAYESALFDSGQEAHYAALTYGGALDGLSLPDKSGALDIGTGDGAFLEQLVARGFNGVWGVEPSTAPIRAAKPEIRKRIRHGMFKAADFKPGSMSLVSCLQTMEHLYDPKGVAKAAKKLLKPGGVLFLVCHSHRAVSAKVLGRLSPIFDVEHLQLFSPKSVARLLSEMGFVDIRVTGIVNHYPLSYWLKLFPMPRGLNRFLLGFCAATGLGKIPLPMPAGNLVATGRLPAKGA